MHESIQKHRDKLREHIIRHGVVLDQQMKDYELSKDTTASNA